MFFAVFLLWIIPGPFSKKNFIHAVIASFIALGISESIKYLFPTLRPFEFHGGPILTLTIPHDSSFPSIHSATSFALASSVIKYDKKIGIYFIIGAILVALGRVLGNVHSMTDVLGGVVIGVCSVILLDKLRIIRRLR